MNNANNYSMTILSILAILGIIVNAIFLYLGSNIATSTIWTYGFSIFSLCGLILISFGKSSTTSGFFQKILGTALPGMLIIGILSAILYQNIAFYGQINDNKVPDEYYTYSGITSFLIIIQVIIVIKYLRNLMISSNTDTGVNSVMSNRLYNVNFIFTIMNITFIAILQVILKLFSTGG
tara:strand:+ start:225 stop:761 length:537 start_codon:yes stop_codon:yes gene_type:complete